MTNEIIDKIINKSGLTKRKKLTNADIYDHFKDINYYLTKADFLAAFSYWYIYMCKQNGIQPNNFKEMLEIFDNHLSTSDYFKVTNVGKFSFYQIENICSYSIISEKYKSNVFDGDKVITSVLHHVVFMVAKMYITDCDYKDLYK